MIVWSRSVSMCAAVPSWRPRATIDSLRVEAVCPSASVTTAWEASWIAISQRSSSVRMWRLAGPATTRSIASSSVAWSIWPRPSRTLSSAASLITLASSAPLKPGVWRATSSSEASGASGRLPPCRRRISRRPCTSGTSTTIWRSKRPGRSSAGSRMSGRLVAPITTKPPSPAKPSISTRIWLSVCSRSSLPWPMPAPRLRPAASSSSMKMIAGAALRALRNRSRTRAAPTPTSDSTKSEPDNREERRVGFAGDRLGEQRLAGAGRPDEQHALRRRRTDVEVLRGVGEVVADLAQLGQRLACAGDVGERDRFGLALALLAAFAGELRERRRSRRRRRLAAEAHEQREQAHEQQDRDQELNDDRLRRLARLLVDAHFGAARAEFVGELLRSARPRPGRRPTAAAAARPAWSPLRCRRSSCCPWL